MRCLYIVSEDPISPNYVGGASAMYYDQLLALAELGHEVHLWHFATNAGRQRFTGFVEREPGNWAKVRECCKTVHLSERGNRESLWRRGKARLRSLLPPRLPAPDARLRREFEAALKRSAPDLVWAQHFEPASLAAHQKAAPVVYVHHDWLYRIKALRNHRPVRPRQRRIEERLVRAASAVISGSKPECDEIKAAGARNVHYIPVSFEPVRVDLEAGKPETPRLVHLGGMGTTANREGLQAFFERVWPALGGAGLSLDVIGDTSAAPPALREHLRTVNCKGFAQDLGEVLRPLDIHIIPWEHSTGQRTRLPLAFSHGQVVVSTKAAVACYPEACDGENCRLVDRLERMAEIIIELAANRAERLRLAEGARETFQNCFTRRSLLPKYAEVVSSVESA